MYNKNAGSRLPGDSGARCLLL